MSITWSPAVACPGRPRPCWRPASASPSRAAASPLHLRVLGGKCLHQVNLQQIIILKIDSKHPGGCHLLGLDHGNWALLNLQLVRQSGSPQLTSHRSSVSVPTLLGTRSEVYYVDAGNIRIRSCLLPATSSCSTTFNCNFHPLALASAVSSLISRWSVDLLFSPFFLAFRLLFFY